MKLRCQLQTGGTPARYHLRLTPKRTDLQKRHSKSPVRPSVRDPSTVLPFVVEDDEQSDTETEVNYTKCLHTVQTVIQRSNDHKNKTKSEPFTVYTNGK